MIVSCPNCSKRYMLDDALLPKEGRQVRCIACYHIWRQVPEQSTFMNFPLFISGPEVALDSTLSDPKRSPWIGRVVFLGIILSSISFIIFGRNLIVNAWPQAERAYTLMGLPTTPPGTGLSILNATSLTHQKGEVEMIHVAGDVVNTSEQVRSIPILKIKLMGKATNSKCLKGRAKEGCVLDYWEHRLSENSLLPGEKIHFETVMRPKVEGAHHISVEF